MKRFLQLMCFVSIFAFGFTSFAGFNEDIQIDGTVMKWDKKHVSPGFREVDQSKKNKLMGAVARSDREKVSKRV